MSENLRTTATHIIERLARMKDRMTEKEKVVFIREALESKQLIGIRKGRRDSVKEFLAICHSFCDCPGSGKNRKCVAHRIAETIEEKL